jgi:hypothetical protein
MKLLIKFISRSFQWFCLVICFRCSCAGQVYPVNYFRAPLEIPLRLAGNFGEIRDGHYHSGIDIKTDSVIGKEVLAAADGYVSRIKVSAVGFGKALYITHPNGYVTVYGHLHHFADSINSYVTANQYEKENFETEIFPDSGIFCVSKGDLIAWSGNTGGSEGPHLHFEIRDAITEKPINPLLFGINVADTLPPVPEKILFRSINENETIGNDTIIKIQAGLADKADTILLTGKYALEFKGYDFASGESNKLGIYDTRLYVNDTLAYELRLSTFAFDETRYANAHIDYPRKLQSGEIYQRCYKLPGDLFSLNQSNSQNIFNFLPGTTTYLRLEMEDEHCNITVRRMLVLAPQATVRNNPSVKVDIGPGRKPEVMRLPLSWEKENIFRSEDASLIIPTGALYEDCMLTYYKSDVAKGRFKDDYLHTFKIPEPAHVNCTLSIRATDFPVLLRNKALIAQVTGNNKLIYTGGTFKSDSITTRVRTFGTFRVVFDTIPPVIENYTIQTDSLFKNQLLSVKITDDLSGIGYYKATLDGAWILMEYDEKRGMLFYTFSKKEAVENKNLVVEVRDKKENTTIYQCTITL